MRYGGITGATLAMVYMGACAGPDRARGEADELRAANQALGRELLELKERFETQEKEKKRLDEIFARLNGSRPGPGVMQKPLEGKILAVSADPDKVVIQLGADDGVKVDDEFTVYRGGKFVAKIVVDRVELRWSAGEVVIKGTQGNPRVADDVSNHILVSGAKSK